jgi:CCR4-NOT transcription complex subunit 2
LFSFNRSWRYHKEWRVWLTKDGAQKYQPVPGGEQGVWVYWSEDAWQRDRKEATVFYADLEDKATPAFAPGITLAQSLQATQQQHAQLGGAAQAPQQSGAQRGFGAMGAM